jgi:hypothetical protein
MSFLTQIIQPPERGSFSNCPENIARKKSGKPSPRLKVKKTKNPIQGLPILATQVSNPRTKGPIQGAATTPRVAPIKRVPK